MTDDDCEREENEPMSRAEEKAAEYRLDANDEARYAAADAVEAAADLEGECHSECVDGTWTYCGCEDCDQRAYDEENG